MASVPALPGSAPITMFHVYAAAAITRSSINPILLMVPLIVMALLPADMVPTFSKTFPVIAGLDDLIALIFFLFASNIYDFLYF